MKKNDWILIAATLTYTLLFYRQYAGLNFLLFNIAMIAFLVIKNRENLRDRNFQFAAASALISSFFIFRYSSNLAITANIFSLAFLSAAVIKPGLSLITGIIHSIVSVGGSVVFMILDWITRSSKKVIAQTTRPFHVYFLMVIVVFLVSVIFFLLYKGANPLFNDFTKKINFDFISIGWIFFTLAGFILLYGFFCNRRIAFLSWFDDHSVSTLTPEIAETKTLKVSWLQTHTELLSGVLLLLFLNSMLLVLNSLDLHYLWFDGTLPKGMKHKEFVHEGVGMLITSIVMAVLILLFYFRGLLNFYPKNKFIRALAYLWIIQNIFMIFSTAWRNDLYIAESGLSYKKIGVYVYLLLSAIGLITTFYKLFAKKSNWYLVRVNAAAAFGLLILGCTINWDVLITQFNIEKAKEPGKKLEKYYLADLGFKNIPYLLTLSDTTIANDDYNARDYYFSSRGVWFENFETAIHTKLYAFMKEMDAPDWRSMCTEKTRIYEEVIALSKTGKIDSLDLRYTYDSPIALHAIKVFSDLKVLRLKGTHIDPSELSFFKNLERLDLDQVVLDSIQTFPVLSSLKQMEFTGSWENDLSFLGKCPNLEHLVLKNCSKLDLSVLYQLKVLKTLFVENLSEDQVKLLTTQLPQTVITNDHVSNTSR